MTSFTDDPLLTLILKNPVWTSYANHPHSEPDDPEETPDQNNAKFQLRKTLAALLHGIDSMPFTREEMLRLMKVRKKLLQGDPSRW